MEKFDRINRIINRNPAKFSGRSKITAQWLQHTFDWLTPGLAQADRTSVRDVPLFVSTYTTINRVLALRGQYLKARGYYSEFQLQNTKSTVQKTASSYSDSSKAKRQRAAALRQGYNKHAGLWTPLTPDELASFRR